MTLSLIRPVLEHGLAPPGARTEAEQTAQPPRRPVAEAASVPRRDVYDTQTLPNGTTRQSVEHIEEWSAIGSMPITVAFVASQCFAQPLRARGGQFRFPIKSAERFRQSRARGTIACEYWTGSSPPDEFAKCLSWPNASPVTNRMSSGNS